MRIYHLSQFINREKCQYIPVDSYRDFGHKELQMEVVTV